MHKARERDEPQPKGKFDLESASKLVDQFIEKMNKRKKVEQWRHNEAKIYGVIKRDLEFDYDISALSCDEHDGVEQVQHRDAR